MTKLLLLSLLALNPEVMGPPRNKAPAGVTATGACATQVTGDVICWDNNGDQGGQLNGTDDPAGSISRPQVCAPGDASCAASSKFFCPGQDTTTIAIDGADPSVTCADDNDTVTVVVYRVTSNAYTATSTVLAEGTDWTASASVANTSTSLAAAVDALAGVSATSTSPNTLISLDTLTCYVTLAESTAGCTTVSTGDYGPAIRVPLDNDAVTPTIAFGDGDTGIYENTDDTLNVSIAGTRLYYWNASSFGYVTATGPAVLAEVASVTNPVFVIGSDNDSGLGFDNANGVVLVSGGAQMFTCDNDTTSCSVNTSLLNNKDEMQTGMTGYAAATITVGAGATTFVATRDVNSIDCDGAGNTIATITRTTGVSGAGYYCMKFVDSSCTITDTADGAANTVDLTAAFAGGAAAVDDAVLCLIHDGTSWHEVSRSAN